MPTVVADLVANIRVSGVAESQAQLEGFGTSLDAAGAAGDAASSGIDAVSGSADAAATSLGAVAGSGDAAATSLDAVAASGDAASGGLERVAASGDAAGAGLGAAGAGADASAASVAGVGAASSSANIGVLALAGGGILMARAAYGASDSFQTWMQDVYSINPALAANKSMQDQVVSSIKATAAATATDPNSLARAFYYAESAGYSTADAMKVVDQGAKAGIAGMADSVDSTKLLVGTMNAYGLSADQAGTVSDKMFTIVKDGVLRFSDLNANWGKTSTMASQLGVSIDELGAGFDALTNKGNAPAAAGVQLTSVMTGLLKPTTALKNEFANLGFANGEDMIKQLGFSGAIKTLYDATGGDPTMLASFFANKNAMKGLMGLEGGSDQGALFDQQIANMQNSGGATDEALKAQEAATSFHVKEMKTQFQLLAIALGDGIRPIVQVLADVLGTLFGALARIPGPILEVVGAVGALISGFAFLTAGGALLETMLGGSLGVVLEGVVGSAIAAAAPFLLLAGAVYLVYEAFQQDLFGIKDQVINAFNAITSAVDLGLRWFGYYRYQGLDPVTAALDATGKALDKLGLGWVANLVTALVDPIANLKTLATDLKDAYNHTKDWSDLLDKLPPGMKTLALGLFELASGFGDLFRGDWQDALTRFGHGFEFLGQAIANSALQLASWTLNVAIPAVGGWLATLAVDAWGALKQAAGWTGDILATIGTWVLNVAVPAVGGWLASLAADAWTALKIAAGWTGTISAIIAGWVLDSIAPGVTGWLSLLASDAWGALKAAAGIAGDLTADLGQVLIKVSNWGYGHWDDVATWLVTTVGGVSLNLSTTLVYVANWAYGKWDDVATWLVNTVGGVTLNLSTTLVYVANWAYGFWNDIGDWISGQVAGAAVSLAKVAVNIVDWGPLTGDFGTLAASIGSAAVTALGNLLTLGSDLAGKVWDAIGGFTGWADLITSSPYDIGAGLGGAIHDAIVNNASAFITSVSNGMAWAVTQGIPQMVNAIKAIDWSKVALGIGAAIVASIVAIPDLMLSAGTAVISGLTGFLISLVAGPDAATSFSSFMSDIASSIEKVVGDADWTALGNSIAGFIWDAIKTGLLALVPAGLLAALGLGGGPSASLPGFDPTGSQNPTGIEGGSTPAGQSGFGSGGTIQGGSQPGVQPVTTTGSVTLMLQFSLNGNVSTDPVGLINGALTSGPGGPGGARSERGTSGFSLPAPDTSKFTAALGAAETFAKTTLGSIFTYAGQWSQGLATIATGAGNLFNKNLAAGMQTGLTSAELFLTTIVTAATAWSAKIGTAATATGTAFNANLSAGMQKGLTSAELFMTTIITAAQRFSLNLTAAAISAGNAFNTNLGNGLAKALTATQTAVSSIVTAVTSGFSGLGTDAYNVGYAIGQGINNGIAFWTSAIAATASGAVTAAITAAKTAGGVASPSREFMIIGSALGEGLHVGLDSWSGALANKSAAIVSGMIGSASQGAATAGGGAGYHFHGPVAVNVKLDGTQPDIGKKVVDAIATAFGTARQMQVGM